MDVKNSAEANTLVKCSNL